MFKNTLIIGLFLILLTGGRLLWISIFNHSDQPYAINGELDLRQWDGFDDRSISLDGEWEFYPHTWLMDRNIEGLNDKKPHYVSVPNGWNDELVDQQSTPYGYGSYRLKILVDPHQDYTYRLRVASIRSSATLFVNGKLLAQSGKPAQNLEQYTAENEPFSVSFSADNQDVIELVIQAANFKDPRKGGIIRSIKFGTEAQIDRETNLSVSMQQMVSFVFLIHAIYALGIFFIGERDKRLLNFSLLAITSMFTTLLSSEEKLLNYWIPINYDWSFRLTQLSINLFSFVLLQCIADKIPIKWRKAYWAYVVYCGAYVLFTLVSPVKWIVLVQPISFLVAGVVILFVLVHIFRSSLRDIYESLFIFLSLLALINNMIWWGGFMISGIKVIYYPFDLIISTICLAGVWFRSYFKVNLEANKLNRKLQEANKLKDQFLANTSHELRNPLHGIINISQTVIERERAILNEKSIKELEMMLTVGRRMSLMLNDLLFAMTLKENTPRLNQSLCSIQSVVTGVIDILVYMKEGKDIKLISYIPEDFPKVYADENRVTQIIFNLLHNALKYTDAGEVSIHAIQKKGKAYISIKDTGIGMEEDTLQRVFEPYEQESSERAKLEGGFGLGLSISRQLVELHGGTLEAHSIVGEGTEFLFTLQLADQNLLESSGINQLVAVARDDRDSNQLEHTDALNALHAQGDVSRILIVDDDVVNLKVLEAILSLENYHITSVTSGKQALAQLEKQEWDLLISDVMMPQMSGYELTERIRTRYSITELPILLLTARSHPLDIEKGFKSGANDYVTKPVDSLELRSRVQALTDVRQSVRERLRMESAWLQAQIQPHFLFNTLNAIAALSEIDLERMRNLLDAFSEFLRDRFKIQNIDELSNVEDELNIVRSYLYIEKERFGDRLHVEWDIDNDVSLKLPLFTIQPLVENAIRHGIMKRMQGGTIIISITNHPTHTVITVADDGVGMAEDMLEQLQQRKAQTDSGVGLLNTDLRLKRQFGTGLLIKSSADQGTEVSFVIDHDNLN